MKLDEAITRGQAGDWLEAQVRVSPSNRQRWFVMLQDSALKSYILADRNDQPIETSDLNELLALLRSLGLKEFTVYL